MIHYLKKEKNKEVTMSKEEVRTAFEFLVEAIKTMNIEEIRTAFELLIEALERKITVEVTEAVKKEILKIHVNHKNSFYQEKNSENSRLKRAKKSKKLPKGLRTPVENFEIPILETVFEHGGKEKANIVIKKLENKMGHKFNDYDLQSIPSNPNVKRWEHTARWCRYSLVKKGLLSSNSPRGIWEITPEGIKYLENYKAKLRNKN